MKLVLEYSTRVPGSKWMVGLAVAAAARSSVYGDQSCGVGAGLGDRIG